MRSRGKAGKAAEEMIGTLAGKRASGSDEGRRACANE
jgi:hypothetical protein